MVKAARTSKKVEPTPGTIARALTEMYRGPAWHGPSVRFALKGVSAARAAWRPAPGRNSIHDLVLHLAYTRYRILHRLVTLQGGKVPRFPRKRRATWFPEAPPAVDEGAWREDLALLDAYQDEVLAALEEADAATLAKRRKGRSRAMASELLGLAFHDAYHAGQIRLLALLAP